MSLVLVSVPIGNMGDITLRALESLKGAELYIGEERKPMFRLLKELGVATPKNYQLLNEHSTANEIKKLAQRCKEQKAVLLTDCGTPGFSDPGAELVAQCRELGVPVTANPGASALTTFLSLCGQRLTEFDFLGFPPREAEMRTQFFKRLAKTKKPSILMDTPYRLQKVLTECAELLPERTLVLGLDLTKGNEAFYSGTAKSMPDQCKDNKREFMLLIH